MSMGVETRCPPCHSAAHHRHMKRQPFLCNGCPCHGRRHCDRHCHLRHRCQLRCCHRRHRPLQLPLPSAIAIAVTVDHRCRHLCRVVVSHRYCRRPCHWPLLSPSPLAIVVAISVGHHRCHRRRPFPRVVALVQQELYLNNLKKECLPYFILFGQWAAH